MDFTATPPRPARAGRANPILARIGEALVASYQQDSTFDLEPHVIRAEALGIATEEIKSELLRVALRVADEENDDEALAALENAARSDGAPWFTPSERRLLLRHADRISDKPAREWDEARRNASATTRNSLIARLTAGHVISDATLGREARAGRLGFEDFCAVRTARAAIQAARRQHTMTGIHADH